MKLQLKFPSLSPELWWDFIILQLDLIYSTSPKYSHVGFFFPLVTFLEPLCTREWMQKGVVRKCWFMKFSSRQDKPENSKRRFPGILMQGIFISLPETLNEFSPSHFISTAGLHKNFGFKTNFKATFAELLKRFFCSMILHSTFSLFYFFNVHNAFKLLCCLQRCGVFQ